MTNSWNESVLAPDFDLGPVCLPARMYVEVTSFSRQQKAPLVHRAPFDLISVSSCITRAFTLCPQTTLAFFEFTELMLPPSKRLLPTLSSPLGTWFSSSLPGCFPSLTPQVDSLRHDKSVPSSLQCMVLTLLICFLSNP